jgi:hypothetical protein
MELLHLTTLIRSMKTNRYNIKKIPHRNAGSLVNIELPTRYDQSIMTTKIIEF